MLEKVAKSSKSCQSKTVEIILFITFEYSGQKLSAL
jgi:hypothetical protein